MPSMTRRSTGTYYHELGAAEITREHHGAKAYMLSYLVQHVRVPKGFVLDLSSVRKDDPDIEPILAEIRELLLDNGRPLIVRSSGSVEDTGRNLYPGRFASHRDIRSVADLIQGLQHCIDQAVMGTQVLDYEGAHELGNSGHLPSVIVQEQIDAEYAGVTFTRSPRPFHDHDALIELVQGSASDLLAGRSIGVLIGVDVGPPSERYTQLAGSPFPLADMTRMLDTVLAESRRVEHLLGEAQDIEWVWDGRHIYTVQARPARLLLPPRIDVIEEKPPTRDSIPLVLPMIEKVGQKAAAALYFKGKGCGALNATVIMPDSNLSKVNGDLKDRKVGKNGTVIRFSHEDKAGLRVAFVEPEEDIAEAYLSYRDHSSHAGIISDYLFVEHAFEAYLDTESLIVEHVPGNWEPQSSLQTDVLIFERALVQAWRCNKVREASYELPSPIHKPATLTRKIDPISDQIVASWVKQLPVLFDAFRRDLAAHLPLNVHFVHSDNGWHFLNIRPIRDLPIERSLRSPKAEFKPGRFFLVARPDDLGKWNGSAPILLTSTLDDASTSELATLARLLHRQNVRAVRTTFGVLSHPALVLREFGLEVWPMYRDHELVAL